MHKMFARKNIVRKMLNVNTLRAFFSSDVKEEMVKVGKHNINYIKVGHGAHSCILTPGALGTATSHYTKQVEGFDRSKFTLVVWDPPGYGKSRPPDREVMTNNYESDADIGHELMKKLNIPRYSVLGWSAGGSASLIHAAKYSDAVRQLVVWATNAFVLPIEIEGYRSIKDVNTWAEHLRAPMEETYGKEKLVQYWRRWVDSMAAGFEADPDICTEHLKNIKCPTLVLHGGRDPLADPTHAAYLIQNIEHSVLHMYPEGKHDIHMRYADDFNTRVQDFLLQPTEK